MKITPEVLENGRWGEDGRFRYKGKIYYKTICLYCKEDCLTAKNEREVYCSRSCLSIVRNKNFSEESRRKQSESMKNSPHEKQFKKGQPAWNTGIAMPEGQKKKISETLKGNIPWNKGKKTGQTPWNKGMKGEYVGANKGKKLPYSEKGKQAAKIRGEKQRCPYSFNNIPKYDLYIDRLQPYERCSRNEEDPNILEVECTYCGKRFIPNIKQVGNRLRGINNNDTHRFYCSDTCKKECPLFYKDARYLIKRDKIAAGTILPHELNREAQPELRQLVFKRDNWTCQKCEQYGGYLHCHHIDSVVSNPIESADADNCITLCKKCHKEVHSEKGCRYSDLRKCNEKGETV